MNVILLSMLTLAIAVYKLYRKEVQWIKNVRPSEQGHVILVDK